jgi:hypothetical protein
MWPRTWTVYQVRNVVNGKGYVGLTSVSLDLRLTRHLNSTDRRYWSDRQSALSSAVEKYGHSSFRISPICAVPDLDLACELERHYIETLDTYASRLGVRNGYNMTFGGDLPRLPQNDWDAYLRDHAARRERYQCWSALTGRAISFQDGNRIDLVDLGLLDEDAFPDHATILDQLYDLVPSDFS